MQKIITILWFIFCASVMKSTIFAQENIEFTKDEFPNQRKELNYFKKKLNAGYRMFAKKESTGDLNLEPVIQLLLPVQAFNPFNEKLNFTLGRCYYLMNRKEKALPYFTNAWYIQTKHDVRLPLWLGICEYYDMLWENSYDHIQAYIEQGGYNHEMDSLAQIYLEKSRLGKHMASNPVNTRIERLPQSVNIMGDKSFPFLSPDESMLIFNRKQMDTSGRVINRIYISTASDSGWGEASVLPFDNYTGFSFEALGISNDGQRVLLRAKARENTWDLYESIWITDKWSNPVLMSSSINTKYDEYYACYGPGDSVLFISSNRPGGLGGLDIWISKKDATGWWQKPEHAGLLINSPFNEYTIHFTRDYQTAYFTSEGHSALGGADIYRSRWENFTFTKPLSIGYPINTSRDENNLYILPNGLKALFSGKRSAVDVQDDIYLILLPPKSKIPGIIREELMFSGYKKTERIHIVNPDE